MDNLTLRGWFFPQENNYDVPTIIFFHENAGSNFKQIY